jgi:hypothetical protein
MNFDIAKYVARAGKLEYEDIDFDAFREQPLDEASLRSLRYMHDVEFHTVCYLRDLLVTRVHSDPEITTFMTMWNHEEFWHGEAIGQVLARHDEVHGLARVDQTRATLGWKDRLNPLVSMLGSALIKDFPAIHMTWGAVNEWVAQAGYSRLIARADHPVLSELLRRIMKQEGKHVDFYASQSTERLEGSKRAQFMTRQMLKRKWAPVGAGLMPDVEVRFLTSYLFSGPDGIEAARRVDTRIDRIPGLEGMHLVENAVLKHGGGPQVIDLR